MTRRKYIGVVSALFLVLAGCDNPLRRQPGEPATWSIDDLLVAGVCPDEEDAERLWMSVLLVGDEIEPDDLLPAEAGRRVTLTPWHWIDGSAEDALDAVPADAFSFSTLPEHADEHRQGNAVRADVNDVRSSGTLEPTSVRFVPTGLTSHAEFPPLLVILMDGSGSLIGFDANTGEYDADRASDPLARRIVFTESVIESLSPATRLSLIAVAGEQVELTPEYGLPSVNRELFFDGLESVGRVGPGAGGTPLGSALTVVDQQILGPFPQRDTTILLVTDGTEGASIADTVDEFLDMAVVPPVIVVHIQPPVAAGEAVRGRDADLLRLACGSGGEYIFLDSVTEFDTPMVSELVSRRLSGAWRVGLSSTLEADDFRDSAWWSFTTRLRMRMGRHAPTVDLRPAALDSPRDTRLWLGRWDTAE